MSVPNSYQLGLECLKARKLDDAVRHLEDATAQQPENFQAFNFLGVAYAQKNMFNRAVGAFLTAIQIQPNVASVHYNLGVAYQADGFKDKALEEYQQALFLDPKYYKAEDAIRALAFAEAAEDPLKDKICGRHVDEPAVALCSFCQLPVCEECKNVVSGAVYCPNCARKAVAGVI